MIRHCLLFFLFIWPVRWCRTRSLGSCRALIYLGLGLVRGNQTPTSSCPYPPPPPPPFLRPIRLESNPKPILWVSRATGSSQWCCSRSLIFYKTPINSQRSIVLNDSEQWPIWARLLNAAHRITGVVLLVLDITLCFVPSYSNTSSLIKACYS